VGKRNNKRWVLPHSPPAVFASCASRMCPRRPRRARQAGEVKHSSHLRRAVCAERSPPHGVHGEAPRACQTSADRHTAEQAVCGHVAPCAKQVGGWAPRAVQPIGTVRRAPCAISRASAKRELSLPPTEGAPCASPPHGQHRALRAGGVGASRRSAGPRPLRAPRPLGGWCGRLAPHSGSATLVSTAPSGRVVWAPRAAQRVRDPCEHRHAVWGRAPRARAIWERTGAAHRVSADASAVRIADAASRRCPPSSSRAPVRAGHACAHPNGCAGLCDPWPPSLLAAPPPSIRLASRGGVPRSAHGAWLLSCERLQAGARQGPLQGWGSQVCGFEARRSSAAHSVRLGGHGPHTGGAAAMRLPGLSAARRPLPLVRGPAAATETQRPGRSSCHACGLRLAGLVRAMRSSKLGGSATAHSRVTSAPATSHLCGLGSQAMA